MLAPALLAGTGAIDWVNVVARSDLGAIPPGPGDVLGAMRARGDDPLGATGTLPETDELSAALLSTADDPSDFDDQLGPFDQLPQGPLGVPGVMLEAYLRAQERLATTTPDCDLDWFLLAGIGRIESGHARGGLVDANGNTASPILGPVLNGGPGMAAIRDTDGGRFDYDSVWDRAVGPMQFIPSTWAGFAADGNNDGQSNPNNIYDATVGAGNYLCSGGGDLSDPTQRARAVFRYNHSDEYVRTVLFWADAYADGVTPLPSLPGSDADFVPPELRTPGPSQPPSTQPPSTQPSNPTSTSSSSSSSSSTSSTSSSRSSTSTTRTTTTTTPTCPTSPTTSTTTTTTTTTTRTTTTTVTTTTTTVPPGCPTPTTTTTPSTTTTKSPSATGTKTASVPASSSMKPV